MKGRPSILTIIAPPDIYTRAECVNKHSDTYKPGDFDWGGSFCHICAHSMHPVETFYLDGVPEDFDLPKRKRRTR